MADRATIDTMNKVLDNLFGGKKYAGGTPQGVSPPGRGNPTQSQDRLKEYVDELLLAGMNPREVSNMLASSHATMKGRASDELYIKQMTNDLQKHVQSRQQPLKPEIQSFQASRNPTVSNFLKIAATKGHTVDIDNVIKAFGINDPRMVESYKNEAYAARSQNAFPRLINFLKQFQNDPAKLASTLRTLKQVKTNNPIFEQISGIPQLGNTVARQVRMLVKATETGLGSSGMGLSQSQMRNYTKSSTPLANLSSISLPSNPAASTQRLAAQFVAEQKRQQAMQQASSVGQSISRTNFLKSLSRQSKAPSQPVMPNLNFMGSRGTHPVNLRDKLMSSSAGRWLGSKSDQIKRVGESVGFGLGTGALGYGAFQLANIGSQAIGAFGSDIARMLMGFNRGGSIPSYAYGGDPLRNIHLTKSPESASKLIGSNVVNSLQSDANSTGLYGLLQSMIKSGSTDASFRGLFYRKGLDANTWVEKVHQMKLQQASTFMNGYFASGGQIPKYMAGTPNGTPFNFRHFNIGRNSKFIKQMYDASAPLMNDSDGQYQMFRAIENKKMGPKDFGLFTAQHGVNPVSALSYQSDGSGIEMTDLGTHPAFQGKGLATSLISKLFDQGQSMGVDSAYWSAKDDNSAGFYNHLGANNEGNNSFSFDLSKWKGRFAFGGDTFNSPLANGPNAQLSADAVKRLQLLRIRAQSGQRLANLRDQAQLNMQLGNTSLFRSPNTAAGVINERVIRNLQSRFSGQPMGKFATGGSIYGPADIPMLSGLLAPDQQEHVSRSMDIAHGIFGQMGKTKLNPHVLDQALQLHDIAKEADPAKHGNFASRFIKQSNILKGSPYESLVSFLVDKHQGTNMPKISGFGKGDQKQLKGLIPLMRIADTLSRGTFDQLPISFGKSGKMKLADVDLGLSKKKMSRLQTSINAYNKNAMGYATGGPSYNNPIRVSDGELAIPRGMVDKIGLSALRRINAGDMSAIGSFASGGLMEFNGPGTGTSDSILTDADRGPKGQDASDIGFIIRRTSSDRLKSIVGRAMGGIIPGYAGGDGVAGNTNDVFKDLLNTDPVKDYAAAKVKSGRKYEYVGNHFSNILDFIPKRSEMFGGTGSALTEALKGYTETGGLTENIAKQIGKVFDAQGGAGLDLSAFSKIAFTDKNVVDAITKLIKTGSNTNPNKIFNSAYKGMQGAYGIDPAEVTDLQQSMSSEKNVTDKVTNKKKEQIRAIDEVIKAMKNERGGMYRGNVRYIDHGPFGENDLRNLGDYVPSRTELTSEQDRLGFARKEPMGITQWYNKHFAGLLTDIGKQMFNPTEQQTRFQTQIKMPIFMDNIPNQDGMGQDIQDHLDASFKEFEGFDNVVRDALKSTFGQYVGDRNIDDLVKISKTTEDGLVNIPIGTRAELYEKGTTTHDGIRVGAANDENVEKPNKMEYATSKQTSGVITIEFTPEMQKLAKSGNFNLAEVLNQVIQQVTPRTGPLTRTIGGEDKDIVKAPSVGTKVMSELVNKTGMTNTGLYKMGDILRGLSWRFASLGMSAMGVYFSIQGLMMTFQQGLGAITTPLADIEALMKNIGMSTAFGDGIMNASKAMDKLNIGKDDFIEGWKNLTNIQGTIQTLFASIGTKVFGGEHGKKFTDELLTGVSDAFKELDNQDISGTIRDLLTSIVSSLPAILPAIKSITGMLQTLAENKFLIEWGAQLMMISLVMQPIASGLAAIVTIGGGVATFGNLFSVFGKALWGVAAGSQAAGLGLQAMALRVGALATGVAGLVLLYEVIANIVNALNLLGDFKLPTLTGFALNAISGGSLQGFANGGVVQSEGYDMVPGHPDDTVITAKAGEIVVDPKKRQGFANAPGLLPSDVVRQMNDTLPAVEQSDRYNKQIDVAEDTLHFSGVTADIFDDVHEGSTLAVTVKNWPTTWGNENGEGNELPFDLGSILPAKLHGFRYNENPNAGNPNTNLTGVQTGINPLGWLANLIGWNPISTNVISFNDRGNDKANDKANVTPNESLLAYLREMFDELLNIATKSLSKVHDVFMSAFDGMYEAAERFKTKIGDLTIALSNLTIIDSIISGLGKAKTFVTSNAGNIIKDVPGAIKNIPSTISGMGKNILSGFNYNYDDVKYNYAGYRKWGDVSDYGPSNTKTTTWWDQFKNGKYVYPQQPSPTTGNKIKVPKYTNHGKQMWPGYESYVPDWVDWFQVGRTMVTSNEDPYAVALGTASMTAGNWATGKALGGTQRVAQSLPAWLAKLVGSGTTRNLVGSSLGKGASALGAMGTSAMQIIAQPEVVIGASLAEGQMSMDKFRSGTSAAELQSEDSKYNAVSGVVTGGMIEAGFGKGIEVLSDHFGKSEEQMRKEINNSWASDIGLNGVYKWFAGLGDMEKGGKLVEGFGEKAKGGNLAVSDILRDIIPDNLKVENVPLLGTLSAEGAATSINESIYDLVAALANLNVTSVVGAGTAAIGLGASGVELAGNTAQMVGENPYTSAQLGITAAIPLLGPFIAALGMPQTTEWMTDRGYGTTDITPIADTELLPTAIMDANVPVVIGLDAVNQSITTGNAAMQLSLDVIAQNTATPIIIEQRAQQALANGGVIGGKSTSTIDDKLIAGEEGEFIVRKDVAQKYGAQLHALNSTGKWPKGYAAGGILGNLKTLYHPTFGANNVYNSLQDTIFKELQSQYKEGMKIQYNFVKTAPQEFRNVINNAMKTMPLEMKQALAASGKKLTFSDEQTFGGKYIKSLSDSGTTGSVRYGATADNIFVKHAGRTEIQQMRTALHEMIHSTFNSAGKNAQNLFTKSIERKGYSTGSNYWFKPTEIAARSSHAITPNSQFKDAFKASFSMTKKSIDDSIKSIMNSGVKIKVSSIEKPIIETFNKIGSAIDNVVTKLPKSIKLPNLSSIEKPIVNVMNSVGATIDNAVKKGSNIFGKSKLVDPTSMLKMNTDMIYKEGKGLLMESSSPAAILTPGDFKGFSDYLDKNSGGEGSIYIPQSPLEQIMRQFNEGIADSIYGVRKNTSEASNYPTIDIVGVYDFNAAIDDATKSVQQFYTVIPSQSGIDTSKWEWRGKVQQPTTGIDTSGWSWGYNNSEMERQLAAYEQQMNAPMYSYQDLEERSKTYGKIYTAPNMDSGWWSQNMDPTKTFSSDAQRALYEASNSAYVGKYGDYYTDPNGNKYSFMTNDDHMSAIQSPAASYNNQNAVASTTTQPITVQITVSGDELATKGYVEKTLQVEVPNIMRANQPRISGH